MRRRAPVPFNIFLIAARALAGAKPA